MRAGRWPSAGASHSSARWSCPCRGRRCSLRVGVGPAGRSSVSGPSTVKVQRSALRALTLGSVIPVPGTKRAELGEDGRGVWRAGVYGGLGGAGAEADAAPVMVEMGHLLAARAVG